MDELKFEWKPVLGDIREYNHDKNTISHIHQVNMNINGIDKPITCVRSLCIMVSPKARKICDDFNENKVYLRTNEIAQVFVHYISQFVHMDIECLSIINKDVIREAKKRYYNTKPKFGYMWNNHLLQNLHCLINTDYKFIGVVEAPKYNTKNSTVRRYPNMNLNIPGGKISINIEDWKEDPELMCVKEALREMTEETGMTISSKSNDTIYNYLRSKNQIEMRKKNKLDDLPLQVYRRNTDSKGDLTIIWLL